MQLATPKPFAGLESIVTENAPLAPLTWYKIGGPAKYLVRPTSIEQTQEAARRCVEYGVPIYVLGLGANVLVNDNGVDGAVFRLDDPFWQGVQVDGETVKVGAGADMAKLVVNLARQGLAGFECMAGIPGTIGGGIRMNAGGKYGDIGAIVTRVTVMDSHGEIFERIKDDLVFEYRRTNIVAPFILGATLELDRDDANAIAHRTKEIWMYKRNTQPLNMKSCGCIFKNPRGLSAGALIDSAGLKGMRAGGAEVSSKHANFVIAHPGATADDVLKLAKIIQDKVYDKHQVVLESEVKVWPL